MFRLLSVALLLVAVVVEAADDGLLVIGAAFGRTGTASTKAALEQLGFGPTHHMEEVFVKNQAAAWDDIGHTGNKEERQRLLRTALKDYRSSLDAPSCAFYKDLMEMYPNAKILLTTRPAKEWVDSAWDTILMSMKVQSLFSPHVYDDWMGLGLHIFFAWTPPGRLFSSMLGSAFPSVKNATRKEDYMRIFEDWQAEVEASVPADRFLKFSVTEGWGPLAQFLDVDVPDTPFPRINDKSEFRARLSALAVVGYFLGLVCVASPLIVYFVVKKFFCKKKSKKI